MSLSSDEQLREFLVEAEDEIIAATFEFIDSMWSLKSRRFKRYHSRENIAELSRNEREAVVAELIYHLKYYGSDGLSYLTRKAMRREAGVTYMTMLRDVAREWNKMLRPPLKAGPLSKPLLFIGIGGHKPYDIPRIASVEKYEEIIVEMIVSKHLSSMSQDELQEALREAGLDEDAATKAAKDMARQTIAGGVLVVLVKVLGKKAVKEIVLSVLQAIAQKQIGKEGAKKLVETLAKKAPQKVFARLISYVGWVLIAWDVVMIPSSPATRITIPTITYLAAMRYCATTQS